MLGASLIMELDSREKVTASILLKKEFNETSNYINELVARLNASKNTDDVRWYNHLIKTQKDKRSTIISILNKLWEQYDTISILIPLHLVV